MGKQKAIMNWSGGKDSSYCLWKVLQKNELDVSCLLTSVNQKYNRISMHGVTAELLDKQCESIGIPSHKILLPETPTMEDYNKIMQQNLETLKKQGVTHSVFGDIFLEDLKDYRTKQLATINLMAVFPLWKIPTDKLVADFIKAGFKAIIVCVNGKLLDKSFCGRIIDEQFVKDLPSDVDPCGENGEFHSFVFDGPIFKNPVKFKKGEIVERAYKGKDVSLNSKFYFQELL